MWEATHIESRIVGREPQKPHPAWFAARISPVVDLRIGSFGIR